MPGPQLAEIRKPQDIILHKERPQKSSSYIPRVRDWRYATGVFRHEDNADLPGGTTCWDDLDEDYMNGVFGKERRKAKGWNTPKQAASETTEEVRAQTPEAMEQAGTYTTGSLLVNGQLLTPEATPKKRASIATKTKSTALSVAHFAPVEVTDSEAEVEWKVVALVVKLRFPDKQTELEHVLSAPPKPAAGPTPPMTPISVRSYDTIRTYEPFEPEWVDETQTFDAKKLFTSLRPQAKEVEDIPPAFIWFPEAVPVDAILPPGVPMSMKEILAYYPHHLRWKGVALRNLNNGYRGPEIVDIQTWFRGRAQPPITGRVLHDHIRALLRGTMEINITKWAGKPDANLYTDHFGSNRTVERRGYTVPTFDQLITGLKYLPTGIHARGLTQCLLWYLHNRDLFTPRLEFNVLHTQSLMRILQIPVKSPGNRKLDMVALQEWKDNGKFTEKRIEDEKRTCGTPHTMIQTQESGSKLYLKLDEETVNLKVDLKLRHVLTMPYMAIGGLYCELLRFGIERVERQRRAWEGQRESAISIDESEDLDSEQNPISEVLGTEDPDARTDDRPRKRSREVDEVEPELRAKKQAMLLKQVLSSKMQELAPAKDEKDGN